MPEMAFIWPGGPVAMQVGRMFSRHVFKTRTAHKHFNLRPLTWVQVFLYRLFADVPS